MINGIILSPQDSVVTVIASVKKGETVTYECGSEEASVLAVSDIPKFHKIAIKDISAGQPVTKYGEFIGYAYKDIKRGEHVHTQNIDSKQKGEK